MTPTITFEDIFAKCRLTDAIGKTKTDARNAVIKFFEHLQAKDFIKTFEFVKHGKAISSIKFIF